jgi:hypothetical protein
MELSTLLTYDFAINNNNLQDEDGKIWDTGFLHFPKHMKTDLEDFVFWSAELWDSISNVVVKMLQTETWYDWILVMFVLNQEHKLTLCWFFSVASQEVRAKNGPRNARKNSQFVDESNENISLDFSWSDKDEEEMSTWKQSRDTNIVCEWSVSGNNMVTWLGKSR